MTWRTGAEGLSWLWCPALIAERWFRSIVASWIFKQLHSHGNQTQEWKICTFTHLKASRAQQCRILESSVFCRCVKPACSGSYTRLPLTGTDPCGDRCEGGRVEVVSRVNLWTQLDIRLVSLKVIYLALIQTDWIYECCSQPTAGTSNVSAPLLLQGFPSELGQSTWLKMHLRFRTQNYLLNTVIMSNSGINGVSYDCVSTPSESN